MAVGVKNVEVFNTYGRVCDRMGDSSRDCLSVHTGACRPVIFCLL